MGPAARGGLRCSVDLTALPDDSRACGQPQAHSRQLADLLRATEALPRQQPKGIAQRQYASTFAGPGASRAHADLTLLEDDYFQRRGSAPSSKPSTQSRKHVARATVAGAGDPGAMMWRRPAFDAAVVGTFQAHERERLGRQWAQLLLKGWKSIVLENADSTKIHRWLDKAMKTSGSLQLLVTAMVAWKIGCVAEDLRGTIQSTVVPATEASYTDFAVRWSAKLALREHRILLRSTLKLWHLIAAGLDAHRQQQIEAAMTRIQGWHALAMCNCVFVTWALLAAGRTHSIRCAMMGLQRQWQQMSSDDLRIVLWQWHATATGPKEPQQRSRDGCGELHHQCNPSTHQILAAELREESQAWLRISFRAWSLMRSATDESATCGAASRRLVQHEILKAWHQEHQSRAAFKHSQKLVTMILDLHSRDQKQLAWLAWKEFLLLQSADAYGHPDLEDIQQRWRGLPGGDRSYCSLAFHVWRWTCRR
mmetsp:Transcript_7872/g.17333  ORF Transcript_7872/g.17333 Transcript_7872/m.17333 type:complete len:480 (+) Transcript_7872:104-1543(+)